MSFNNRNDRLPCSGQYYWNKTERILNIIISFLARYEVFIAVGFKNFVLLGYDAVLLDNRCQTLRNNVLPATKTIRLESERRLLF
jgi:hypothetical protein